MIAALGIGLVAVSGAGAAKGVTSVPDGDSLENATAAVLPLGASNAVTEFVLQVAGDPVVLQDAKSKDNGNGPLSDSQKSQARDALKAQQAPIIQQVEALGGQIVASFQGAYNGVAVRIAANKASQLATITGVTGVFRSLTYGYEPLNIHGVPLVQGPQAWGGTPSFTGAGTKIADIDTGLDYTHADFGGPGHPGDFLAASGAASALPANPAYFGPSAAKVKGGIDLVGDSYNAAGTGAALIPHPDPNPLDCNGHGTHTAGTAAGFGVLSDGSTFGGPYNATTVSGNTWDVGPGVAPQADLYAIRVFGCTGSVDDAVLIQAMEWAVDNNMDAINMSLGAPFGNASTPSAQAATNAAKDGVIVVSASGNNGPARYITSSPGSASGTLAVAANDPTQSFPGAIIHLSTGPTITAIDANGFQPIPAGPFPIQVIWGNAAHTTISLGCSAATDSAFGPLGGKYIVVARGTCGRVAKAIYGQQAGAAGVIMVNNSSALPPYEGKITTNPDDNSPYTVTIPFLGVRGGSNPSTSANGVALRAANGGTLTLAGTTITNTGYLALASFSSAGPRSGDSALKPQVTAPGVSIASAAMGSGTDAVIESGTSMATPHTTGTAALVKQAHPDWRKVTYWNAAIANTASTAGVAGYNTVGAGSGLIQAFNATHTQVVALGDHDSTSLDYGLYASDHDFSGAAHITLRNFGSTAATFNVADALDQGSPHSVSVDPSTVTVPAHGATGVDVTLNVPIASAGDAYAFNNVAGLVAFTPAGAGDNSGISLDVPYLLVPQASSDLQITGVDEGTLKKGSAVATLTNNHGATTGVADWFAWGLTSKHDHALASDDLMAAGIQSFPTQPAPTGAGTGWLLFGISVAHRWSNPAEDEFDVLVDVNNDGTADYDVFAADRGAVTAGSFSGQDAVFVLNLATNALSLRYLAGANFNGSTIELPVDFSQLGGISASTPITYTVESFGIADGTFDQFNAVSTYNLFHPVFSNNSEDLVDPNTTATDSTSVDLAQWGLTPQLGLLALNQTNVRHDNNDEAFTFPAKLTK